MNPVNLPLNLGVESLTQPGAGMSGTGEESGSEYLSLTASF